MFQYNSIGTHVASCVEYSQSSHLVNLLSSPDPFQGDAYKLQLISATTRKVVWFMRLAIQYVYLHALLSI